MIAQTEAVYVILGNIDKTDLILIGMFYSIYEASGVVCTTCSNIWPVATLLSISSMFTFA